MPGNFPSRLVGGGAGAGRGVGGAGGGRGVMEGRPGTGFLMGDPASRSAGPRAWPSPGLHLGPPKPALAAPPSAPFSS